MRGKALAREAEDDEMVSDEVWTVVEDLGFRVGQRSSTEQGALSTCAATEAFPVLIAQCFLALRALPHPPLSWLKTS